MTGGAGKASPGSEGEMWTLSAVLGEIVGLGMAGPWAQLLRLREIERMWNVGLGRKGRRLVGGGAAQEETVVMMNLVVPVDRGSREAILFRRFVRLMKGSSGAEMANGAVVPRPRWGGTEVM